MHAARSLLVVIFFVSACGSSSVTLDAGPPDAGLECGPFVMLEGLSVTPGGRVVIERSGALADPTLVFEGSGGEVVTEPTRVLLLADVSATEASITIRCASGAERRAEVAIRTPTWTVIDEWEPGTDGPPAREYGAFWLEGGALYVFSGFHYVPAQFTPANDLWRFELATAAWSELTPEGAPFVPGARAAAGPDEGSVLIFGGGTIAEDGSLDTPSSLLQLEYGDGSITDAPFADRAPGSYTGAFVHDAARDRWLSVCGADARVLGVHCVVHAYTPAGGWQRLEVADGPAPRGRYGFHYALDVENDRVIVAAGQDQARVLGDTWALELSEDPPRWVELAPDDEVVRRRNGAFVLDPIGQRLLVFGGTADGRTSRGLVALRLTRGHERWDELPVSDAVPLRTSGLGLFDPAGRRAIFGFGNGDAVYTDLIAFSL